MTRIPQPLKGTSHAEPVCRGPGGVPGAGGETPRAGAGGRGRRRSASRLRRQRPLHDLSRRVRRGRARADDPAALLARLRSVGREGAGNPAASPAWRELARQGPDALVPILGGMDGADVTAANWLRAAVDAIAERELAAGRGLPADRLEAF